MPPIDDLFSPSFYCAIAGCNERDAYRHFTTLGDASGLDPGPYFSTLYYKERYPDWARSGARTALEDFGRRLQTGEVRRPHPLIDPEYYRSAYPDLASLGTAAVLHFARHGDEECRSPSARFDAGFYAHCYLGLQQRCPFRHYVTAGRQAGYLPRPSQPAKADARQKGAAMCADLPRPLFLCAHDAQPAGVPLLTLDLAAAFGALGWNPVFLLQRSGPLHARFQDLGPVVIVEEGWDLHALAAGLAPSAPAIINTAAAAHMVPALAGAGLRCVQMIHEMPDYIRQQGLMPNLISAKACGAELVASMPSIAAEMRADLGTLGMVRPGIRMPKTRLGAFRRVRTVLRPYFHVFIGAGHADRRKGFDLFLEAARDLAEQLPGASFVWLGQLDGWAQKLADQALSDGLNLILPGFVDDAPAWYHAADVYLLTSRQDPGPATVVHAARMGTPFVGYAADIGLIGQMDWAGHFVPSGERKRFVDAACETALGVAQPHRRWIRRRIKAEAGFDEYVTALAARFSPGPLVS